MCAKVVLFFAVLVSPAWARPAGAPWLYAKAALSYQHVAGGQCLAAISPPAGARR
ncbi:hypothetical protein [Amycolatopsis coloradensis]|uniref:hypothetical protein n=1 Tax=Amycolatopsis coloradensis TaxID=76021 RepID=UPI001300FEBE|nr:hypothetical protein [Amycolatopsis coloradensis]